MFTGIIEKTGEVVSLERNALGGRLTVDVGEAMAGELAVGESVAVNGCCLTSVPLDPGNVTLHPEGARSLARESASVPLDPEAASAAKGGLVAFDLLEETLRVTNLGDLRAGSLVNLERSLRVGDRLSGHFVQGHVDAVGQVLGYEEKGGDHRLEVSLPAGFEKNVIHKGSIAIDGISLTLGSVTRHPEALRAQEPGVAAGSMIVWIIPHTHEVTNLKGRKKGDGVNLEFDVLGKYVAAVAAG